MQSGTLPSGDAGFALRWRLIKSAFSRSFRKGEFVSASRLSKGERGIWQRRYWIRDERDFTRHVDYIHFNSVRHGHVPYVAGWPYSSFRRFVRLGVYPADWAGDGAAQMSGLGERQS